MKKEVKGLTSIRGLAAWWVVIYHFRDLLNINFWPLQKFFGDGYLAVDLFFELSGLVMSLNYCDDFINLKLKNCIYFMYKRLLRIYPLHFVVLFLFLINPAMVLFFSHSRSYPGGYTIGYFLQSLILVQNWGFTSSLEWNVPAWSISTEWFAYFIFPFIIHYFLRFIKNRCIPPLISITLFLTIAAVAIASRTGLGAEIPKYGLIRCVLEFSIGISLWFFYNDWKAIAIYAEKFTIFAFLLLFCLLVWSKISDYYLAPVVFYLLLLSIIEDNKILSRIINNKAFHFLGLISYSTYMVHFLVRSWIKFILIGKFNNNVIFLTYIIATFFLSVFFYYFVEIRGRKILDSWIGRYLS